MWKCSMSQKKSHIHPGYFTFYVYNICIVVCLTVWHSLHNPQSPVPLPCLLCPVRPRHAMFHHPFCLRALCCCMGVCRPLHTPINQTSQRRFFKIDYSLSLLTRPIFNACFLYTDTLGLLKHICLLNYFFYVVVLTFTS